MWLQLSRSVLRPIGPIGPELSDCASNGAFEGRVLIIITNLLFILALRPVTIILLLWLVLVNSVEWIGCSPGSG